MRRAGGVAGVLAVACGGAEDSRRAPRSDDAGKDSGGRGGTASGGTTGSSGAQATGGSSTGGGGIGGSSTGGGGIGGSAAGGQGGNPSDASMDSPIPMDAAADRTAPDAAMDGGAADAAADRTVADAADGAVDGPPPFDAGPGCIAPNDSPLSAAAAGLPAAGLVAWLRADHGIHKTATDGVCAWADARGSGHVFQPLVPGGRPLWESAGLAGLPAVHFSSTGPGLIKAGVLGLPPQSARTFIVVQRLVSLTGRFHSVIQGLGDSPGTYVMIDTNTWMTAGSREGVYAPETSFDSDLATAAGARLHVFSVGPMIIGTPVAPALSYRINRVTRTLTTTSTGSGNGTFLDFSSANFTMVGNAVGGEALLAEVLVYDHVLSTADRNAVEAALSTRYAIP